MRRLLAVFGPAMLGWVLLAAPAHADQINQNLQLTQNPQIQLAKEQTNNPPKTHTVTAGENLSSIAADNGMDSWRPLWNANAQINDPNLINVGDQLVIPDGPTTDRPLPDGYDTTVTPSSSNSSAPGYQPVTYHATTKAVSKPSAPSGDVFARIRQRESGGRYNANTGNGYYGAYQFDDGTWGGYGGYKHASDAPASVQDAKAAETYARRGCSPWPNTCY